MNRPTMRLAAAALGGLSVVTVFSALVIAAVSGRGPVHLGAGWVVPLVAGCSVGLLSWFLLTDTPGEANGDARGTNVSCSSCGTEVREDWRLCPYCGGSIESPSPSAEADVLSAEVEG